MEKFDKMIEKVLDELSDSIEYAESYISEKMKGNSTKSAKFKDMALNEHTHAQNWYMWAEEYASELEKIMPLTVDDVAAWERCQKIYAEKSAIIKYMLDR